MKVWVDVMTGLMLRQQRAWGGENGREARRDREPFVSAVWTLQRLLYVLWKSMHAWRAFLAK